MPRYDYHCPENGQTIEVSHGMTESLDTWAELCQRAEIDPGDTPADSTVERAFNTAPLIGGITISGGGGGCGGGGGGGGFT